MPHRGDGLGGAATGVASERLRDLPPGWAYELAGAPPGRAGDLADHEIDLREGEHFSLLSTAAACPPDLSAHQLEELARDLYLSILERARSLDAPHLARVWNFVPRILEPVDDLPHVYMAFNAGRFHAYRRWFGPDFSRSMPTASGVGNPRPRLVIHALTADRRASPVDNPRQVSSHCYSPRYGPLPPCFARAAELELPGGGRWLLAGGTASVVGERTVHDAELEAQTRETFLNLAALIDSAAHGAAGPEAGDPAAVAARLDRYRYLRVYLPDPADTGRVGDWVRATFRRAREIEIFNTDLCRPDLMVEIEGAAELEAAAGAG